MASPPSPRTWVDKEMPLYSTVNTEIYTTVSWLLRPPMCKVRQTTAQTLTSGVAAALTWQTADVDEHGWFSTSTPTRIKPTYSGWYRGWYSIGFSTATGGNFRQGYVQNTNAGISRSRRNGKVNTGATNSSMRGVPFFFSMNGTTDYLEVFALQDSGADMVLPVTANLNAEFFCRWWAPL